MRRLRGMRPRRSRSRFSIRPCNRGDSQDALSGARRARWGNSWVPSGRRFPGTTWVPQNIAPGATSIPPMLLEPTPVRHREGVRLRSRIEALLFGFSSARPQEHPRPVRILRATAEVDFARNQQDFQTRADLRAWPLKVKRPLPQDRQEPRHTRKQTLRTHALGAERSWHQDSFAASSLADKSNQYFVLALDESARVRSRENMAK